MEQQIANNVKKKFQQIRRMYKENKSWRKDNILSAIGVPKPPQQDHRFTEKRFSVTDIINNVKKNHNKYSEPLKSSINSNNRKKLSQSPKNHWNLTKRRGNIATTRLPAHVPSFSKYVAQYLRVSSQPNIKKNNFIDCSSQSGVLKCVSVQ